VPSGRIVIAAVKKRSLNMTSLIKINLLCRGRGYESVGVVEEGVMEWDCFGGRSEGEEKRWFRCWSIVCFWSRGGGEEWWSVEDLRKIYGEENSTYPQLT